MKRAISLALSFLPLLAQAQTDKQAPNSHAPVFGLRAGYTHGRLVPTSANEARTYRAQAGWEVGGVLSSNTARRAGVALEANLNYLRFTDQPSTPDGAQYRWLTAQPTLVGCVRPVRRIQLLAGGGFNLCLSCWRRPFTETPGAYGYGGGDQASSKTSAPAGAFVLAGVRGAITPRWFVEGRYATTLGEGGYRFYKTEVVGATTWGVASVGYWLNPRSEVAP